MKALQFEQVKGMILIWHPYNTIWEARNVLQNQSSKKKQ